MSRYKKSLPFRILVIEDNFDHWRVIESMIRHTFPQAEAIHTENEVKTLRYLEECSNSFWEMPRLILLDLYLPQKETGLELLQQMKSNGAQLHYPPDCYP